MAKDLTKEEKAAAKAEAAAAKKAEKEEAAAAKAEKEESEATVSFRGKTRTYTKEIHGDKFKDLAKSFAKKFDGEIV